MSMPSDDDKHLLLLDIEARTEQVRQMKSYEPRRLVIQATTVFAAAGVVGWLLVRLFQGHG